MIRDAEYSAPPTSDVAVVAKPVNPHFPALRSGPTAGSGASAKTKVLAASSVRSVGVHCRHSWAGVVPTATHIP